MNPISLFSNNIIMPSIEPVFFIKTEGLASQITNEIINIPENLTKKKFVSVINKNLKDSYVYSVRKISHASFTNSRFNNIPRNKRSAILGIRRGNINNSTRKYVVANQSEQNPTSIDPVVEEASNRLKSNLFHSGMLTDIKTKLDGILEDLRVFQTDKQRKELATTLKELNQYRYKETLEYNPWQDTFTDLFKEISQYKITNKDQFDVFNNWVKLVTEDTPISLDKNPNQVEVYLTRLHEVLISSNEKIQEGMHESSNILFSYSFFKTIPDSEYKRLKEKVVNVINESFNACEKLGGKKYYYFIRNILLSFKNLVESTEEFVLREDVLHVLKDQFKNFYQRTRLTMEQQIVVKQLSYLAFISIQKQQTSLSEFCQEFTVKDMYPYEKKTFVENVEISFYSAIPLEGEQFEHILEDLKKTNDSFKRAFHNLMDTKTHKVNIFIAKSHSSYEIFNYSLLGTATGNGGVLNYFTPSVVNGNILDHSTPSITVYQNERGRIHNLEHEYNHALFDFYVNFKDYGLEDLLTKYNFNWLNEGLSFVLDPNYSGREDCKRYLTRNKLPKIESIITALNQDYTISYIFTEYLLNKEKSRLVEMLSNIKNRRIQTLKDYLEALPSLEAEFLNYVNRHWSLQKTMVTTEDGNEYDVKIKIDQILKELQSPQIDTQWESLAAVLKDLGRSRDSVDYNKLRDSFESVYQVISQIEITTKSHLDVFTSWVQLVSDKSLPNSLQQKPNQITVYLSRLYEILISSNPEIQDSVGSSSSALFYYGFFEKLSTRAYTELRQKLELVIQATFEKCESYGGKNYYHFIKEVLHSYSELMQSIKKFTQKKEVLNMLKNQFKIFYQRTKLTPEQQTTIRQLSYIILSPAQQKDFPLAEFCQKFSFKDMYPSENKMSVENIEINIYSNLPLTSERFESIRTVFKQSTLHFKTAFSSTVAIETNYRANLLIAKDESSSIIYHYPLLRASEGDNLLNFLQGPTVATHETEGELLRVEYAVNQLLYDVYIGNAIEECGEYKFKWLSEGLSSLLIFPRSNQESEILAKLISNRLPSIEEIIKGPYQGYEFSFALTYYLYEKHRQSLDKILFYVKMQQKGSLKQEAITLTSLDTDFHAFWSIRLRDYQAKYLRIQELKGQLLRILQERSQRLEEQSQETDKLSAERMKAYKLQDQLNNELQKSQLESTRNRITQQLKDLQPKINHLEDLQEKIMQQAAQEEEKYQLEKKSTEGQLQLLQYQISGSTEKKDPTTRVMPTTSTKKDRTTQRWMPSKDTEVLRQSSTDSSRTSTNSAKVTTEDEIIYEGWTPIKGWRAVKNIAGISVGISYTILAAFLSILMVKRKSIKGRIFNSPKSSNRKPRLQNLENQRPLLISKQAAKQKFYRKNKRNSQKYGNAQV